MLKLKKKKTVTQYKKIMLNSVDILKKEKPNKKNYQLNTKIIKVKKRNKLRTKRPVKT